MCSKWPGDGQGALPSSTEASSPSDHVKFLEYAAWQREQTADQLIAIRAKIMDFQRQEGALARKVEAFDVILDRENATLDRSGLSHSALERSRQPDDNSTRSQSEQGVRVADAVVSLLRSSYPQEMHFRVISEHLLDQGLETKGQDPANTFLSYFSNDDRLERVARGTYRAKHGSGTEQS